MAAHFLVVHTVSGALCRIKVLNLMEVSAEFQQNMNKKAPFLNKFHFVPENSGLSHPQLYPVATCGIAAMFPIGHHDESRRLHNFTKHFQISFDSDVITKQMS